ncbi:MULTISPECIES: tRNA (guanosine(37)-N1)-methyltransferase TrmD [Mesotoga]|uniref:tRNA (guanosine(37)-N1)-methyltransferase TrmD n=1 Tax=Mesotoga TaxID=1184396 RepID=UPI001BD2FD9A|nr:MULTISPECIES: tRNA (guanosine(37)-N1)-methyltransferase TrmD [Mesotoga]MCP5456288.1 tRNA (guanosine(37)-N1)-methyltransferase TrmD [Thermotogota bacterium]HNQ71046.1 tRNA (guanosine(37)-N1)-methyltransferase TrmD [Mesotoga prima]HNS75595.1 tRNA (guanosine(37)-N1)-methyltransferase TrmD [Mesotoga prima]HOP37557.1 tRNA (guanosine(37)-N1)-methyltransferase TrmD [Mesotoga prima]HPE53391.1 tRNA (guanosine(37)-N1)-methyltransferase TrmD [Mesotoga prima]
MKIEVLTIFPQLFETVFNWGVISRAIKNGIIAFESVDIRDFTDDRHRTTDDYPFGGGSGLVMKAEPIIKAVASRFSDDSKPHVVYPSPQGKLFDNKKALELSKLSHIVFVCGRYEGIDERAMSSIDEEISIGDFVLSGGEIPALLMIEVISRFVPGVVGDMESVINDSFFSDLLDYAHYTRPREVNGMEVPEVLLSGNHEMIAIHRRMESLLRTIERRPDIFLKHDFDLTDKKALLLLFKELKKDAE